MSNVKRKKKSLSVGARLYVILVLLTMVALAISFSSIYFTKVLRSGTESISEGQLSDLTHVSDIIAEIQTGEKFFYQYLYEQDASARTVAKAGFDEARNNALEAFAEMKENVPDANQEQFQEFADFVDSGFIGMENVIALADSGADYEEISAGIAEIQETLDGIDTNVTGMHADSRANIETSKTEVYSTFDFITSLTIILTIIMIIIIGLTFVAIRHRVVRPLRKTTNELKQIISTLQSEKADLSDRISVESDDEIGVLAENVNHFMELLEGIISKIVSTSDSIQSKTNSINDNIASANSNSTNISAVTQQLSASMELVSDTTTGLAASAQEILSAINSVADETKTGNELVEDIQTTASEIKNTTHENKAAIQGELEDRRKILEDSIKEAQKVSDISSLTDEILEIASQTNLLALNASIEAARAGEAGKGFAVVAEEIRTLADGSRKTANNIQEISEAVIKAVENLMANSNGLLEYMSERINTDYNGFEQAADEYYGDAEKMKEIVGAFADSMDALLNTTQEMTDSLSNIANNISECSTGVTESAENICTLVNSISDIRQDTEDNYTNIESLNLEVSKFR
jgi:methyl-accepting chemotaxis protein